MTILDILIHQPEPCTEAAYWRRLVSTPRRFASLDSLFGGRSDCRKLVVFALVMLAVGRHGWAIATGCRILARSLAVALLAESFVVVPRATALPVT